MIKTQKELADTLVLNKSTISRYLARDDFPVTRNPPWTPADVQAIRDWQAELQQDRSGRGRTPGSDRFYLHHPPQPTPIAVVLTDGIADAVARDPLAQPPELCTDVERAIITGKARPTRAQVAALVSLAIRFKAMVANLPDWMPGHLANLETAEVQRRLRAVLYGRVMWHAEAVARALGQTPAGGKGEGE